MLFPRNDYNKNRRSRLYRRKFVYSKKTYSNPFFNHKKSSFFKSGEFLTNKIKLTIFALIIAAFIFIWLLFFSALFKITKIEVSGIGDSAAKEIESIARNLAEDKILGKNNLLLYDKSGLISLLNDKYYLESITVKKNLLHTLKIILQEKLQTAVWLEDNKYFYLDGDGNTINQVDPLSVNRLSYPLIENRTDIKMAGRKANINQATIKYALDLFNEFKEKKHGFEIERFILDKDINTVKIAILDGPKIYFNIKEEVMKQVASLDLVIREKLKDDFKSKEYIDLRYGSNIYIK